MDKPTPFTPANDKPQFWPYNAKGVRTPEEQIAWREGYQQGYDAAFCEMDTLRMYAQATKFYARIAVAIAVVALGLCFFL